MNGAVLSEDVKNPIEEKGENSKKQWYIIQVISSQEKRVKKRLEDGLCAMQLEEQIEEVMIPLERVYEVRKGERRIIEKKLWPGYLLVHMQMNNETWSYVRYTQGVLHFVGNPTPLSEREISQILQNMQSKEEGALVQKYSFQKGNRVKITNGVFLNSEGEVLEIFEEKGVLSVSVEMFGRKTRVDDLEFWQIETLE